MEETKHRVPVVFLSPLHINHDMCAVVQVSLHMHTLPIPKRSKVIKITREKVIDKYAKEIVDM